MTKPYTTYSPFVRSLLQEIELARANELKAPHLLEPGKMPPEVLNHIFELVIPEDDQYKRELDDNFRYDNDTSDLAFVTKSISVIVLSMFYARNTFTIIAQMPPNNTIPSALSHTVRIRELMAMLPKGERVIHPPSMGCTCERCHIATEARVAGGNIIVRRW